MWVEGGRELNPEREDPCVTEVSRRSKSQSHQFEIVIGSHLRDVPTTLSNGNLASASFTASSTFTHALRLHTLSAHGPRLSRLFPSRHIESCLTPQLPIWVRLRSNTHRLVSGFNAPTVSSLISGHEESSRTVRSVKSGVDRIAWIRVVCVSDSGSVYVAKHAGREA